MYHSDLLPQNEGILAPVEDDGGQVGRGEGIHPSRTTNLRNKLKSKYFSVTNTQFCKLVNVLHFEILPKTHKVLTVSRQGRHPAHLE